ncbi:hypothetical protein WMW72_14995 [Paenibacillus filicis]|uniref:Lipoprotein n=1 Tax=Paenibacillus filicis TaxID=669464 RepID=A0ABU9DLV5_9BACL
MRRLTAIGLLAVGILGLTGCSRTVEFQGESDTWKAACTIQTSAQEKACEIRYTGDVSAPNSRIVYSFKDSSNFQFSGERKGLKKGLLISSKAATNRPVKPYTEEDEFTLHIRRDDREDVILLAKMGR